MLSACPSTQPCCSSDAVAGATYALRCMGCLCLWPVVIMWSFLVLFVCSNVIKQLSKWFYAFLWKFPNLAYFVIVCIFAHFTIYHCCCGSICLISKHRSGILWQYLILLPMLVHLCCYLSAVIQFFRHFHCVASVMAVSLFELCQVSLAGSDHVVFASVSSWVEETRVICWLIVTRRQ